MLRVIGIAVRWGSVPLIASDSAHAGGLGVRVAIEVPEDRAGAAILDARVVNGTARDR
jgi:hypothetical protein